jgi:hypothetical protein
MHGRQTLNADPYAGQVSVDEVGASSALRRHQAQQDVNFAAKLQPVPDESVRVFEGRVSDNPSDADRDGDGVEEIATSFDVGVRSWTRGDVVRDDGVASFR